MTRSLKVALVPVVSLLMACSAPQRAPAAADGATSTTRADGAPDEDSDYIEVQRVAEGHAYVARLVCPGGAAARSGTVATSVDARGRFIDSYLVECPSGPGATVVVPPVGPLPEPPEGFRLLDQDAWEALHHAERALRANPELAGAQVDAVLRHYPGYVPALRLRALVHALANRPVQAVAGFDAVVRADPQPLYRLEQAATVRQAGDLTRYLELLLALRRDVKDDWRYWPELQCRIGAERVANGEADGMVEVREACDRGFADCCDIVKARSAAPTK